MLEHIHELAPIGQAGHRILERLPTQPARGLFRVCEHARDLGRQTIHRLDHPSKLDRERLPLDHRKLAVADRLRLQFDLFQRPQQHAQADQPDQQHQQCADQEQPGGLYRGLPQLLIGQSRMTHDQDPADLTPAGHHGRGALRQLQRQQPDEPVRHVLDLHLRHPFYQDLALQVLEPDAEVITAVEHRIDHRGDHRLVLFGDMAGRGQTQGCGRILGMGTELGFEVIAGIVDADQQGPEKQQGHECDDQHDQLPGEGHPPVLVTGPPPSAASVWPGRPASATGGLSRRPS